MVTEKAELGLLQIPGKLFLGMTSEAGGKHCRGLAKAGATTKKHVTATHIFFVCFPCMSNADIE